MGFWRRRGVVLYKVRTYKYAEVVPRSRVIMSTTTPVSRKMHGWTDCVYLCKSPKEAEVHLAATKIVGDYIMVIEDW